MTARGIRNNNPGNIRKSTTAWVGEVNPGDDPEFCQFTDMTHGIRALAIVLLNYQLEHNLRSIDLIVERWAPNNENDTQAYIKDISQKTGWDADALLNLKNDTDLTTLTYAMCEHECGEDAALVTHKQLVDGIAAALSAKGIT